MLILQRKPGESVMIGSDISISVISVEGGRVRLAISAPVEVPILRSEPGFRQGGGRPRRPA